MEALGKLHMTVTRAYKVYLDDGQCKHVHEFIVTFLRLLYTSGVSCMQVMMCGSCLSCRYLNPEIKLNLIELAITLYPEF